MTNVKRLVVEEPPLSMDYQMTDTASSCSSVRSRILRPRLASPPSHAPRHSPNIFRTTNTATMGAEEETFAPIRVLDTVKGVLRKFLPDKWLNSSEGGDNREPAHPTSRTIEMNGEELMESALLANFTPLTGRSILSSPLEKECVEDIYRRLLRPGRDRVSLYRDFVKFFRAQGNCLLSQEQFEELALLIQRQAPVTPMRLETPAEPVNMGGHTAVPKRERTVSAQVETSASMSNILSTSPAARPPVLKPVAVAGALPGTPSARRSAATCRRIRRARVFSARFEDADIEMLEQMEWQREVEQQQKVSQLLGTVTARQRLAEETRKRMTEQIRLANAPPSLEVKEPTVTLPSPQAEASKFSVVPPSQQQPASFEFTIPSMAPSTIGAPTAPSAIPKLTFDLDSVPAKEERKVSASIFKVPEEKTSAEALKTVEFKETKAPTIQPTSTSQFTFAPAPPKGDITEKKETPALPLQSGFTFGLKTELEKPEEGKPSTLPAFSFTPSFGFGLSKPSESKEEVRQVTSTATPASELESGLPASTPFSFSTKPVPSTTDFSGGFGTFGTTSFGTTPLGALQSSEKKAEVDEASSSKRTNFSGIFGETKPSSALSPASAPAPFSSLGSTQSVATAITEPKVTTPFGAFATPSNGEKASAFTFGATTEVIQPAPPSPSTSFGFGTTSLIPPTSTTAPSFGTSGFGFGSNQASQPPSTGFSFGGGLSTPGVPSTTAPTTAPPAFSFGGAAQHISSSGGALFSAPPTMDATSEGGMIPGADAGDARRFSKPISRRRR